SGRSPDGTRSGIRGTCADRRSLLAHGEGWNDAQHSPRVTVHEAGFLLHPGPLHPTARDRPAQLARAGLPIHHPFQFRLERACARRRLDLPTRANVPHGIAGFEWAFHLTERDHHASVDSAFYPPFPLAVAALVHARKLRGERELRDLLRLAVPHRLPREDEPEERGEKRQRWHGEPDHLTPPALRSVERRDRARPEPEPGPTPAPMPGCREAAKGGGPLRVVG